MRSEQDSLGQVLVPDDASWGAQTQRAIENFRISGLKPLSSYVRATALVKQAAAEVNMALNLLDSQRGQAIAQVAARIAQGEYYDQFVVDPFQAGAGTSHNMNANEVIANLANETLCGKCGIYLPIHPNDHVNMAQSTNDVIPAVIRVAASLEMPTLLAAIHNLAQSLADKAKAFDGILKSGRTHLQDAVPVRLGQEFGAYAVAVAHDGDRITSVAERIKRLGIGGTAAGTGLNSHPSYHAKMIAKLSELTSISFISSGNLFESMQSTADLIDLSAALRTLAVTLTRICNDLRLLSSGPSTGLSEITLPALQPGSSIMPGKVNPVMPEMLTMVCFRVIGNDETIMLASQAGQLELNVMMPVIAYSLLQSIEILTNGLRALTDKCIVGIQANAERCSYYAEHSSGLATALNAYIGYQAAAKVAQEALARGVSLRQVALEHNYLTAEQLDVILDPRAMTEPGIPGKHD
jgi:fumarate hydratase, class II